MAVSFSNSEEERLGKIIREYDDRRVRTPYMRIHCAWRGKLLTLKWLHEYEVEMDRHTLVAACDGGQIEVIEWLRSKGCPWGYNMICEANKRKNYHVADWLNANGYPQ